MTAKEHVLTYYPKAKATRNPGLGMSWRVVNAKGEAIGFGRTAAAAWHDANKRVG